MAGYLGSRPWDDSPRSVLILGSKSSIGGGQEMGAKAGTNTDTNGDTGKRTFLGRKEMGALGLAFVLSCLATVSQLIEAARGQDLGFGEVWGALVIGVALLLLVAVLVTGLRRASPGVLAAGTVALAALAWLSMVAWWAAAPAYLGIAAVSLAGLLDRAASPPSGGSTRTAGIVGLFAAGANAILIVGAFILTVVGS
jgi:hypothetical protein